MNGLTGLLVVALVIVLVFGAVWCIIQLLPIEAGAKQIALIILAVLFALVIIFKVYYRY
jgi:hypothetical protein